MLAESLVSGNDSCCLDPWRFFAWLTSHGECDLYLWVCLHASPEDGYRFGICGSWQLWCLEATWLGAHISCLIGCIVRNLLCVGLFACARA